MPEGREFGKYLYSLIVIVSVEPFACKIRLLIVLTRKLEISCRLIGLSTLELRDEYLIMEVRKLLELENETLFIHLDGIVNVPLQLGNNSDVPANLGYHEVIDR
jgi:hypothetical protein